MKINVSKFSKAESWITYFSTLSEMPNISVSNWKKENICTFHKKRGGIKSFTTWAKEKVGISENVHIYSKYNLRGNHKIK